MVHIFTSKSLFADEFRNDPYYKQPDHAQHKVYATQKLLYEGTTELQQPSILKLQNSVPKFIRKLQSVVNIPLPADFPINVLRVDNTEIEFGASWTCGRTVLISRLVTAKDLVTIFHHELVHVMQRFFPQVFHELYLQYGFRPIHTSIVRQLVEYLKQRNFTVIDNPDACFNGAIQYTLENRWCVYTYDPKTRNLKTVQVDLDDMTIINRLREKFTALGVSQPINSPNELFAEIIAHLPRNARLHEGPLKSRNEQAFRLVLPETAYRR